MQLQPKKLMECSQSMCSFGVVKMVAAKRKRTFGWHKLQQQQHRELKAS